MLRIKDATFSTIGFLIISAQLLLLGCQAPKENFDFILAENTLIDSVYLQAKINNFDLDQNELFLSVKSINFLSNQNKSYNIPIQKFGIFQLSFPLEIGGSFELEYENEKLQISANQVDRVQILLDGFGKKNKVKTFYQITDKDTIKISNQHLLVNQTSNLRNKKQAIKHSTEWEVLNFMDNYYHKNYWDSLFQLKENILKKAKEQKVFSTLDNEALKTTYLAEFLYDKTEGYEREVILAKYVYELMTNKTQKYPEKIYLHLIDKIKSKQLKNYLTQALGQSQKVVDTKINFLQLKDQKNILQTIKERHRGKAIYLDFWATWCIPCLKEMSIYPKLKQTVGEQVAFVYLAINSPEKDWQSIIKQWKLEGDHYLLDQEEYDMLHRLIYIETIPHYVLLNKQGQIVDDFAPKPSMGEGKKINPNLIKSIHQILIEE